MPEAKRLVRGTLRNEYRLHGSTRTSVVPNPCDFSRPPFRPGLVENLGRPGPMMQKKGLVIVPLLYRNHVCPKKRELWTKFAFPSKPSSAPCRGVWSLVCQGLESNLHLLAAQDLTPAPIIIGPILVGQ